MTWERGCFLCTRALGVFAQCQASGSQEANTSHLNGKASTEGPSEEQTEGPWEARACCVLRFAAVARRGVSSSGAVAVPPPPAVNPPPQVSASSHTSFLRG